MHLYEQCTFASCEGVRNSIQAQFVFVPMPMLCVKKHASAYECHVHLRDVCV
jgi:hypothetical protein